MADTNNETSPAASALVVKGIHVGSPVPVDAELDSTSDNPVSNKAVCNKFDDLDKRLDSVGAIYTKGYSASYSNGTAGGSVVLASLTLPPGTYILQSHSRFEAVDNTTGARVWFRFSTATFTEWEIGAITPLKICSVNMSNAVKLTQQTTINFIMMTEFTYTNKTIAGQICAIRVV